MKNKIIVVVISALLAGIAYYAYYKRSSENLSDKPYVTASFYPIGYLASLVAGDRMDVVTIIPTGGEPHDYEPTPKEFAKIGTSKAFFFTGVGFEGWGDRAAESVHGGGGVSMPLFLISATLKSEGEEEHAGKMITDPHVWLDPVRMSRLVDVVLNTLSGVDPDGKDIYAANAKEAKLKFLALDAEYKEGLSSCATRNIVTSHAAFSYLAERYDLNQISIAGISPDAEPSPRALANISSIVKSKGITTVFVEELGSPKLAETVARETGAQLAELSPVESATEGEDYFSKMRANLIVLKQALNCK
jgi:zinc transport system substrate-binding protein